jgi:hypothetical protein
MAHICIRHYTNIGNFVQFSLSYALSSSLLRGSISGRNTTSMAASFSENLSAYSFRPGYSSSGNYHFGIGGSANTVTSWGAVYASLIRA